MSQESYNSPLRADSVQKLEIVMALCYYEKIFRLSGDWRNIFGGLSVSSAQPTEESTRSKGLLLRKHCPGYSRLIMQKCVTNEEAARQANIWALKLQEEHPSANFLITKNTQHLTIENFTAGTLERAFLQKQTDCTFFVTHDTNGQVHYSFSAKMTTDFKEEITMVAFKDFWQEITGVQLTSVEAQDKYDGIVSSLEIMQERRLKRVAKRLKEVISTELSASKKTRI